MALLEAGVILGGAYLLSRVMGQGAGATANGSVAPTLVATNNPLSTQTVGPSTGNDAIKTGLSVGLTALTTGIGIVKGIVGGGAGAAGGSAAAANAAAIASAAGAASFFSAPPLVIAGIILTLVVANAIGTVIGQSEAAKHFVELMNGFLFPIDEASALFKSWTASAVTYVDSGNGWRPQTDMTPELLREVALACIWSSAQLWQARNDAFVKYYSYLGWNVQQMATAPYAGAVPGKNFLTAEFPADAIGRMNAVKDLSGSLGQGYSRLVAPFSPGEPAAAAARLFGDKFTAVSNELRFAGQSTAVLHAIIEGYGGVNVAWNNWPGDQKFTETLASIFGWIPSKGVYWVTSKPAYPMDSWWLVDPFTGYRIETIQGHHDSGLRVSKKGVEVSPGVFAGFRGFGAYGASSQCVQDGQFVPCPVDANGNAVMPGADASGNPTFVKQGRQAAIEAGLQRQVTTPVSTAVQTADGLARALPWLAVAGGAAYWFMSRRAAKKSTALSGFSRRRVRRNRS